jgi:NAD(P)-dependent dehydrogenase (short-subunit alcohol dehydrogenase family)
LSVENYASYPSLIDRTVFVTGGADGIGSAVVQNFAARAAGRVCRHQPRVRRRIERCGEAGAAHTPIFYEVDCATSARRRRGRSTTSG